MLNAVTAPELFDRTLWSGASVERREELARDVGALLGDEFRALGMRCYAGTDLPIAVYLHLSTGAEFSLVPGGGFDMGISPEEELMLRRARYESRAEADPDEQDFDEEFDLLLSELGQMRPLHRVVVPPFLISQRVISVGQVQGFIDNFRDPLYGHVPAAAAHLTPEQITAILVGTGMRLPAEAELEYAARGGLHRCLLPTGDRIPDENTIEAMIADTDGATHNAFGLHGYGLYPELCADAWHEHYKGAPDDGSIWSGIGMRVVRGGAADCYPWQGCGEWNMLLCAYRQRDRAAEFGAAMRMVKSLADLDDDALEETREEETTAAREETAARESTTREKKTKKKTKKKAAKKTTTQATAKKSAPEKAAKKTTTQAAAKKSAPEKTPKKTTTQATAKKSATKTSATKKTAKQASTKSSATEKSTAKKTPAKATSKKPTAKKSAAKATSKKPTAKKSAAKKPA